MPSSRSTSTSNRFPSFLESADPSLSDKSCRRNPSLTRYSLFSKHKTPSSSKMQILVRFPNSSIDSSASDSLQWLTIRMPLRRSVFILYATESFRCRISTLQWTHSSGATCHRDIYMTGTFYPEPECNFKWNIDTTKYTQSSVSLRKTGSFRKYE